MKTNYMCGKLIKQIHDELEKQANSVLNAQNLTLAQMHVLMELRAVNEHQLTLKQLEGLLHVAQSTVAGIVNRLEQKGYVVCFVDGKDRRVKRAAITADGLACCTEAQGHIEEMENRLLAGLTEAEKEAIQKQLLIFLLRKLQRAGRRMLNFRKSQPRDTATSSS